MSFFSPEEAAALAATTVRVATLVDLLFEGDPAFIWNGFGTRQFLSPVPDVGLQSYIGAGDLGSIDGLEEARAPVSQQVTFTLTAVEGTPADLLGKVLDATDIVQGKLCVVSMQLFDDDWIVIGNPLPIYFGIMQPPRVTRQAATAETGAVRTMSLTTENLFFGRARPRAGRYTDREQQTRFPGDKFCEFTPQMVNRVLAWPDY